MAEDDQTASIHLHDDGLYQYTKLSVSRSLSAIYFYRDLLLPNLFTARSTFTDFFLTSRRRGTKSEENKIAEGDFVFRAKIRTRTFFFPDEPEARNKKREKQNRRRRFCFSS